MVQTPRPTRVTEARARARFSLLSRGLTRVQIFNYEQNNSQQVVELPPTGSSTIADVKNNILTKEGIPPGQQRLVFDMHQVPISVQTQSGSLVTIHTRASDTIATVKASIQQQLGMHVGEQRLMFAGQHLDDNRTLSDYNIQQDSTLHVIKTMQLFVKTVAGTSITIDAAASDTIADVKEQIFNKEGIKRESQRLVWSGKNLDDSRTLADYSIQQESTLWLALRVSGGGAR